MIEVFGNVWDYAADFHCVTTNGDVNARGQAVMGRGVARQAALKFPGLAHTLARVLKETGNHVHFLGCWEGVTPKAAHNLVSFPVKHHWYEQADLELIARSCTELVALVDRFDAQFADIARATDRVVLPRPGCANGQRDWDTEVRPIVADLLDDRFHLIDLR